MPHVGRYLIIGIGGLSHTVLTYAGTSIVLLILVVVVPAVWSTSKARRTAAQEVLDKLLRFLRPNH